MRCGKVQECGGVISFFCWFSLSQQKIVLRPPLLYNCEIMSSLKAVSIALLASLGLVGVCAAENITSDTYFYGQSPEVAPRKFLAQFCRLVLTLFPL